MKVELAVLAMFGQPKGTDEAPLILATVDLPCDAALGLYVRREDLPRRGIV